MRPSRFLKPVAYLQRPACSRPFFSLPSFPGSRFGTSEKSTENDDQRRNYSIHDEDEPEGNEDEVQRYHERKILPCATVGCCPYSYTVLTPHSRIDIVRRSCTNWSQMSTPIDISCHFVTHQRSSTPRGRIGGQTQEMDLWNWKQNSELGFWD